MVDVIEVLVDVQGAPHHCYQLRAAPGGPWVRDEVRYLLVAISPWYGELLWTVEPWMIGTSQDLAIAAAGVTLHPDCEGEKVL